MQNRNTSFQNSSCTLYACLCLVPDWGANFLWYLFENDLKQSKNWYDSHFNLAADSSYGMFYFVIQFAQHGNEARAASLE